MSLAVAVVASVLAIGGALLVVVRDLSSPERRLTSTGRDVVEILAPAIGLVVLVWLVWAAL